MHNRLYTPHSSKIACSRFSPLTVQTTEGWVALMPHLTGQPEPAQLPNEQLWRAETEEFKTVGLYSPKELEEWQENAIPQLQKATLGAVAYGNCLAVGECTATGADNIPVYSLAKLSQWYDLFCKDCTTIF
ncbi:MAG: hypothetical protein GY696_34600 [Gammaproteobacteria bacterium]|nr:hypothetical protein [Gammaproteobacteria bacterium]